MKLTRHNGRSGNHGTYNPRHNDRRFDVQNSEHIDAQRAKKNVYWDCYRGITTPELREKPEQPDFSFEEIERKFIVVREFLGDKTMQEAFEQLIERQTCEHFEEWLERKAS